MVLTVEWPASFTAWPKNLAAASVGNGLSKNAVNTSVCAWAPPSMAPHIFERPLPTNASSLFLPALKTALRHVPLSYSVTCLALHGVWSVCQVGASKTVRSHGWRSPSAPGMGRRSVFWTPLPDRCRPRSLRQPRLQAATKALSNLKQASGTHASAYAHGDDYVFDATTLAFDQGVADQS